ncbi:hypothetical protein DSM106972_089150 [Dulcicalothrix desertica PCC 7102]|uniref:Uncharacterized protein n=1 Tax=Dulcicalothrix desertica PCC 7102 TaxID=232991 RepID=A0A433UQ18_9CYAN|nr:hypothetical protein [Dulcicalothrix desertica]RUS95902.1 hypothetical protein DSM106972_089150 [Dulcicalothrix desertica PCC 7102]TWH39536.1 hypothetical protein CAL7102_08779 [Dulcicalothrix desertica PCC 7102]
MSVLLGVQIKEIGRTFIVSNIYSHLLMDTLYFKTYSNTIIQLVKANQDSLYLKLSSKQEPIIDPEYEIEPEDKLIFKAIDIQKLSLPVEFKRITEFWAGVEDKEFLIGFVLHGNSQEALLAICTETDEIEIIDYDAFRQRVESFPFYYRKLSTYWYQNTE